MSIMKDNLVPQIPNFTNARINAPIGNFRKVKVDCSRIKVDSYFPGLIHPSASRKIHRSQVEEYLNRRLSDQKLWLPSFECVLAIQQTSLFEPGGGLLAKSRIFKKVSRWPTASRGEVKTTKWFISQDEVLTWTSPNTQAFNNWNDMFKRIFLSTSFIILQNAMKRDKS